MDTSEWRQALVEVFPRLSGETFDIVAPSSTAYNRIAYAAGDVSEWWGISGKNEYWPDFATRSHRMESLIEVFVGLGYQQCKDSRLESGFEKVALYEQEELWKHAALQTLTRRWRSQMGQGPLIEHLNPESLSDGEYGSPTIYIRRYATPSATAE